MKGRAECGTLATLGVYGGLAREVLGKGYCQGRNDESDFERRKGYQKILKGIEIWG
jgi:hypothetical protein